MVKLQILILVVMVLLYPAASGQETRQVSNVADTIYIAKILSKANAIRKTNPDSAVTLSRKALFLSKNLQDNNKIASSFLILGAVLFDQKQYVQSKAAFESALPYCLKASPENKTLLPRLYNNLANIYIRRGTIDSALRYYYLSLHEINKRKEKDSSQIMLVMSNIGGALVHQEHIDQALYYIKNSLLLGKQLRDSSLLAQNYLNLGNVYESKFPDSARYYYDQALVWYKKMGSLSDIQDVYGQIGVSWGTSGNLRKAGIYFDSSLQIGGTFSAKNAYLQMAIGNFYLGSGKYTEAIRYLTDALKISKNQEMTGDYLPIYDLLAFSYYRIGQPTRAYQYQKIYSELRDSLLNEDKIQTINELEVQYRIAEKDKQLTEQKLLVLQKENTVRTQIFWISGITCFTVLLALFFLYFYRNRHKLDREKMAKTERQQEIDRLLAVMEAEEQERNRIARDLHDGIGVLISAAMMNYTVLGKRELLPQANSTTYKEGMELLQEMRQEIRIVTHNLVPGKLAQQSLASVLQILVSRLQSNTVKIEVHIYGTTVLLEPQRNLSLYRMIEELLQNVVRHAEASEILIQLLYHEDRLNIIVKDNGIGFDTSGSYEGIGIHNLYTRAAKLDGEISIVSGKEKGTTVELEIPY